MFNPTLSDEQSGGWERLRDVKVLQMYEDGSQIQRLIIGRQLLK